MQLVLFGLCAANELYFLLIYLLAFPEQFTGKLCLSRSIFFAHHLHRFIGAQSEWIRTAAWAVLPFCAMKHLMNFIQLCSATMNLVKLEASGRVAPSPVKATAAARKRQ